MARVRIPLNRTKASQMPPACMICGGPVDTHVARLFTWRPPFLSLGFLVSVFFCFPVAIAILVVGFVSTRRVTVECPVCERHRGYFAWRGFWMTAPLLVITSADLTVGLLIVTRVLPEEAFVFLLGGTAAAILVWASLATVLQRTGVRCDEISPDDVRLSGIDRAFADLLHYEHGRRKSAPDYGWEEYDPYPRRPALP